MLFFFELYFIIGLITYWLFILLEDKILLQVQKDYSKEEYQKVIENKTVTIPLMCVFWIIWVPQIVITVVKFHLDKVGKKNG